MSWNTILSVLGRLKFNCDSEKIVASGLCLQLCKWRPVSCLEEYFSQELPCDGMQLDDNWKLLITSLKILLLHRNHIRCGWRGFFSGKRKETGVHIQPAADQQSKLRKKTHPGFSRRRGNLCETPNKTDWAGKKKLKCLCSHEGITWWIRNVIVAL